MRYSQHHIIPIPTPFSNSSHSYPHSSSTNSQYFLKILMIFNNHSTTALQMQINWCGKKVRTNWQKNKKKRWINSDMKITKKKRKKIRNLYQLTDKLYTYTYFFCAVLLSFCHLRITIQKKKKKINYVKTTRVIWSLTNEQYL